MNGLGVDDIYTAVAVDVGDKGGSVRETKNSAEANSKQERRQPGISEKMTREGLYDAATVCPATNVVERRDPLVPRRMTPDFLGKCLSGKRSKTGRSADNPEQIKLDLRFEEERSQVCEESRRPPLPCDHFATYAEAR